MASASGRIPRVAHVPDGRIRFRHPGPHRSTPIAGRMRVHRLRHGRPRPPARPLRAFRPPRPQRILDGDRLRRRRHRGVPRPGRNSSRNRPVRRGPDRPCLPRSPFHREGRQLQHRPRLPSLLGLDRQRRRRHRQHQRRRRLHVVHRLPAQRPGPFDLCRLFHDGEPLRRQPDGSQRHGILLVFPDRLLRRVAAEPVCGSANQRRGGLFGGTHPRQRQRFRLSAPADRGPRRRDLRRLVGRRPRRGNARGHPPSRRRVQADQLRQPRRLRRQLLGSAMVLRRHRARQQRQPPVQFQPAVHRPVVGRRIVLYNSL